MGFFKKDKLEDRRLEKVVHESTTEIQSIKKTIKQIRDNSKSTEAMFKTMVTMMPDFLTVVLVDNTIEYATPKFCKRMGYSLEEVTGQNIQQFMCDASYDMTMEYKEKRIEGDSSVIDYYITLITKSGGKIDSQIRSSPVYDGRGDHLKSVVLLKELTAEEKVRGGLAKIQKLGEVLLDMGFIDESQLEKALSAQKQTREDKIKEML